MNKEQQAPIGVFDSGLGGLTVVAELRRQLPGEDVVYFGDTARVPYGTKSPETVRRFALEDATFLLRFNPKMIVVACNTASAAALDLLRDALPVPVCGVVEPGAAEAVRQARESRARSGGGGIAVLATEATVNADAYPIAIRKIDPTIAITQCPCPLLVPLVEEGRTPDDAIVRMAMTEYLSPLLPLQPGAVLLGCTHYPLLKSAVEAVLGPSSPIVDSAQAAARAVVSTLADADLLCEPGRGGTLRCYVSDNPQRFAAVGSRFLGRPLRNVTWISPEQFLDGSGSVATSLSSAHTL